MKRFRMYRPITVTIYERKTDGDVWEYKPRTHCQWTGLDRAVRRHFGPNAWFNQDSGLPHGYGCIARSDKYGTHLETPVRIEVKIG